MPSPQRLTIGFDNDGTLLDTQAFYTGINHEQGKKHGLQFLCSPDITRTLSKNGYWTTMRDHGVEDKRIHVLLDEIEPQVLANGATVKFFAGMAALVKELHATHDTYVVTDSREAWLTEPYQREGISVREILGLEKGPHKKERLQEVKRRHPEQVAVYVCDTTGDCRVAREEGYRVIAVTWGFHSKEWLAEERPDFLVHTPQQIRESIDAIARNGRH